MFLAMLRQPPFAALWSSGGYIVRLSITIRRWYYYIKAMNVSKFTTYHTHPRHIFSQNERMIQSKTDTVLVANPRPRASLDAAPFHGLPGDPLQ
jgi:hypothetical protein